MSLYDKTLKGVRYTLETQQTVLRIFKKGSIFTFGRQSISTLYDSNVSIFNRCKSCGNIVAGTDENRRV